MLWLTNVLHRDLPEPRPAPVAENAQWRMRWHFSSWCFFSFRSGVVHRMLSNRSQWPYAGCNVRYGDERLLRSPHTNAIIGCVRLGSKKKKYRKKKINSKRLGKTRSKKNAVMPKWKWKFWTSITYILLLGSATLNAFPIILFPHSIAFSRTAENKTFFSFFQFFGRVLFEPTFGRIQSAFSHRHRPILYMPFVWLWMRK